MQLISTSISDLFIIQPKVFEDPRGYFYESYNRAFFEQNNIHAEFVQDNQSLSQKNVLRGLHFQNPPYAQGKLVRVISGSVLDVAVDIRKSSPTYGRHHSVVLSGKNKTMFWIPPGFAHGFLTLEDNTIFAYKCTNLYNKASEDAIIWNDPDVGIDWGTTDAILSEKDKEAKFFKDLKSQF